MSRPVRNISPWHKGKIVAHEIATMHGRPCDELFIAALLWRPGSIFFEFIQCITIHYDLIHGMGSDR